MRLNHLFICLLCTISFISCNEDDDTPPVVELRDKGEQALEDDADLQEFLATHFYNYEDFQSPSEGFTYDIEFDTIAGSNADKTSLLDSDDLIVKTLTRDDVTYKVYVLKVREGEGMAPKFTDSTLVGYEGALLNMNKFDASSVPVWFDQVSLIPGFTQGVVEFKSATGFMVNSDNSVSWNNDFGIGAIFIPSGLAYFANSQERIPPYSPIVFKIKLFSVNEADHDRDGIPSWMEDLDGDGIITNDDTDEDTTPNYADRDDDGDGTLTRNEIVINEDGSIAFPDANNNGTPDYLDADTFQ